MNKEQIAKLKTMLVAMPSAPFGYSFGTGYVARKTENSYFHVAQAPSGMSSTIEWQRNASFIAALLEAAPELIALAERALLAAAPAPIQQEPVAPARQALHTMQYEDGRIGWYFDCDGHYIDVEKDGAGKYSVYFRDRATGKEGWLDQADSATPPALAGSQVQAAVDALDAWNDALEKAAMMAETQIGDFTIGERAILRGAATAIRTLKFKPNADCSGDPANCPDNEGYGCACDPGNKAAMRDQP